MFLMKRTLILNDIKSAMFTWFWTLMISIGRRVPDLLRVSLDVVSGFGLSGPPVNNFTVAMLKDKGRGSNPVRDI